MSITSHDVVVIGAGPAGCSAAIELVRRGFSVTIIEKSEFPRHRIGESLPPKIMAALTILGIEKKVQSAGFAKMTGTSVFQAGELTTHIASDEGSNIGLQVDRSKFDQILLQHAKELGCKLILGRPVTRIELQDNAARVWTDDEEHGARWLIDASGTRSLVARHLDWRRKSEHRTLALCGYWRFCRIPEEVLATNTLFEMLPDAWIWSVLRSDGLRNITVGIDPSGFEGNASELLDLYHQKLDESSFVGPLAAKASLEGELLSYESTCFSSDAYIHKTAILVGDAASFIDPLTSQGVYKAMQSGIMAAALINTIQHRPEDEDLARTFYQKAQDSFVSNYEAIARSMYRASPYLNHPFWKKRISNELDVISNASNGLTDLVEMARQHGGDRIHLTCDSTALSVENIGRASGGFIEAAPMLVHSNGQSLDLLDVDAALLRELLDGRSMSEVFEAYAERSGEGRSNELGKRLRDALGKMLDRGWLQLGLQ